MSDELRNAFEALMTAFDQELKEKDAKIDDLRCFANHLESENNKLKLNLKNTAGILASAAHALQEGLNDY